MVRVVIIGIVIAVAFTLYALVDAAMTDSSRARGVGKPVWVVLIVVLPVIGAALWFLIGKGQQPVLAKAAQAPDDDPRFTGKQMSRDTLDDHMKDLEARLKELDDEVFPGEGPEARSTGKPSNAQGTPSGSAGAADASDAAEASDSPESTPEARGNGGTGRSAERSDTGLDEAHEQPGKGKQRPDGDVPRP